MRMDRAQTFSTVLQSWLCKQERFASTQSRLRGGEGGIRTLGTGVSPYNGLANRRIRPLCHLSANRISHLRADTFVLLHIHCMIGKIEMSLGGHMSRFQSGYVYEASGAFFVRYYVAYNDLTPDEKAKIARTQLRKAERLAKKAIE